MIVPCGDHPSPAYESDGASEGILASLGVWLTDTHAHTYIYGESCHLYHPTPPSFFSSPFLLGNFSTAPSFFSFVQFPAYTGPIPELP